MTPITWQAAIDDEEQRPQLQAIFEAAIDGNPVELLKYYLTHFILSQIRINSSGKLTKLVPPDVRF